MKKTTVTTVSSFVAIVTAGLFNLASASPFYRETFNTCLSLARASQPASTLTGWSGVRGGSRLGTFSNLKVNAPGSAEAASIKASPQGGAPGGALWARNTNNLLIASSEISFNVENLTMVSYDQRLSGRGGVGFSADGSKLALRIGNTWYISSRSAVQRNTANFETVTWQPQNLTYGTSPHIPSRGPLNPTNRDISLPASGVVSEFGVFIPLASNRVRIDNFTLSDGSSLPYPEDRAFAEDECISSLAPIPTPTPAPGDPEVLCTQANTTAVGRISLSRNAQTKLLRSISARTAADKRDIALLTIAFDHSVRLHELVNVLRSGFIQNGNKASLTLRNSRRTKLALTNRARTSLLNYIRSVRPAANAPLFQSTDNRGKTTGFAICSSSIIRTIRGRANRAKVGSQLKFVR